MYAYWCNKHRNAGICLLPVPVHLNKLNMKISSSLHARYAKYYTHLMLYIYIYVQIYVYIPIYIYKRGE